MRIAGADLSTFGVAYVGLEEIGDGFTFSFVRHVPFRRPTEAFSAAVYETAYQTGLALTTEWQPNAMFTEAPFIHPQHSNGAMNLAGVSACWQAAVLRQLGQHSEMVPPSTWKKQVVGHGNASKDDVKAYAERDWPMTIKAVNDNRLPPDVLDALCVALYGVWALDNDRAVTMT